MVNASKLCMPGLLDLQFQFSNPWKDAFHSKRYLLSDCKAEWVYNPALLWSALGVSSYILRHMMPLLKCVGYFFPAWIFLQLSISACNFGPLCTCSKFTPCLGATNLITPGCCKWRQPRERERLMVSKEYIHIRTFWPLFWVPWVPLGSWPQSDLPITIS